ncbi:DUF3992 domain-containing protein [Peribacillus frigoritolerans]|uniref:DUF3992 domain-containing protein n=1 Tax=Peribacillus frigoritolerans TaxID=450367 RepID=UPI0035D3ED93
MMQYGNCCSGLFGIVSDAVCFTVNLSNTAGVALELWNDATPFIINGTIVVENNGTIGASPTAALSVNDTPVGGFIVTAGQVKSITMNNINSIGLIGSGTGTASVRVSFSLNYKF